VEAHLTNKQDRDTAVDELLKRAFPRGDTVSGGACLDADMAAAWIEHRLPASERTTAERHVAGCSRCQALLAALVRTSPEPRKAPWWQAPAVKWLVPAATVAGLTIWVGFEVTHRRVEPVPVTTNVQPQREREELAARRTDAAPATPEPAPAPPSRRPQEKDQESKTAPELSKPQQPKPRPAQKPPNQEQREQERQNQVAKDTALEYRLRDADKRDVDKKEPAAPPGVQERVAITAGPTPAASGRQRASGVAGNKVMAVSADDVAAPEIVSPDPSNRWRIGGGSVVLRSTNGGVTWEHQDAGYTGAIAGASPDPTVCWLVGRAGIVLLTIDGRTWQRVSFIETADLVSVRATSADAATVTTADGRTFTTTDRGRTWTPPGLQESSAAPF
jgi:outer membrane biosynthesis protein TonB